MTDFKNEILQNQKLSQVDWNDLKKNHTTFLLNVTKNCNSNCKICYAKDRNNDEMTLKDVKFVMSRLGKGKKIVITGGEPTTRQDLSKIIKQVKDSGNHAYLYTNGLRLSDREYVQDLKKSGIEFIILSFDGFKPDTYKKLRSNQDHLTTKLHALKNLKQEAMKTQLSYTVVQGINEKELGKTVDFAVKNNDFIKSITFTCATPIGRFDVEIDDFLTPKDIIEILSEKGIRKEYFTETKKFYDNMGKILSRMGRKKIDRKLSPEAVYEIKEGKMEEIIKLEDLTQFNKDFENKKFLGILGFTWKYKRLGFELIKSRLDLVRFEKRMARKNVLNIFPTMIVTPIKSKRRVDTIEIMKKKDDFLQCATPI
ncbi:MAG: radical SAM protein [Nanoarchaeota archaeon]|nr:radical SAM protein [Nanoarchaeota archaeon]